MAISRHVHGIAGISEPPENASTLLPIAQSTIYRSTWLADDLFKIILNPTYFGCVLTEVELRAQVFIKTAKEARQQCILMTAESQKFMQRYSWAFGTRPVIEMLTAYFA